MSTDRLIRIALMLAVMLAVTIRIQQHDRYLAAQTRIHEEVQR